LIESEDLTNSDKSFQTDGEAKLNADCEAFNFYSGFGYIRHTLTILPFAGLRAFDSQRQLRPRGATQELASRWRRDDHGLRDVSQPVSEHENKEQEAEEDIDRSAVGSRTRSHYL